MCFAKACFTRLLWATPFASCFPCVLLCACVLVHQTLLSSGTHTNVVAAVGERLKLSLVPLTPTSLRVAVTAADALSVLVEGPVAQAIQAAASHVDVVAATAAVLSYTGEDWEVGRCPLHILVSIFAPLCTCP